MAKKKFREFKIGEAPVQIFECDKDGNILNKQIRRQVRDNIKNGKAVEYKNGEPLKPKKEKKVKVEPESTNES